MLDQQYIEWFDAEKQPPEMIQEAYGQSWVSRSILFACNDGKVYAGHYHINGCYYADLPGRAVAYTMKAILQYGADRNGLRPLWWCDYPLPPPNCKPIASHNVAIT
jgi:hypothetical protein